MAKIGSVTIRDYSDELTVTRWNATDATLIGDFESAITDLFNGGVIFGLPIRTQLSQQVTLGFAGPVNSSAQRELKWVLSYEDNQQFLDPGTDLVPNPGFGKIYNLELGTAVPGILPAGTDILPPTAPEYPVFEDFLSDANVRSPTGGTVTLRRVRLVGRNI